MAISPTETKPRIYKLQSRKAHDPRILVLLCSFASFLLFLHAYRSCCTASLTAGERCSVSEKSIKARHRVLSGPNLQGTVAEQPVIRLLSSCHTLSADHGGIFLIISGQTEKTRATSVRKHFVHHRSSYICSGLPQVSEKALNSILCIWWQSQKSTAFTPKRVSLHRLRLLGPQIEKHQLSTYTAT